MLAVADLRAELETRRALDAASIGIRFNNAADILSVKYVRSSMRVFVDVPKELRGSTVEVGRSLVVDEFSKDIKFGNQVFFK